MMRILLVGCGKMGGAMLAGWLDRGLTAGMLAVVEPDLALRDCWQGLAACVGSLDDLPVSFVPDVVVIAVKPQMMAAVLPAYSRFGKAVFLSIAAGKTLNSLAGLLGDTVALVRAMPNTPAAVQRGMTVAVANAAVSAAQRDACDRLLSAVGAVEWVGDEALIDAVTAVSGSGPAYVFLLAEVMAAAGEAAGLPAALSAKLARATVSGSGALLDQVDLPPAVLRQNVTSPNGTTYAALQVLMRDPGGMQALLTEAIAAATTRSRELAG